MDISIIRHRRSVFIYLLKVSICERSRLANRGLRRIRFEFQSLKSKEKAGYENPTLSLAHNNRERHNHNQRRL